jgi:hypothetical protein
MTEKRACMGGKTEPCRMSDSGHGQKCLSCGTRVRDDQVNSTFFGFAAGCLKATAAVPTVVPSSS